MSPRNPVTYQRVANRLAERGVPVVPGLITLAIRLLFACYCPHGARIGRRVSLGYGGLGVVISAKAVIGDDVEIGHGVTLGGNAREAGAPTIGDGAYLGAGCCVLGPVRVGAGAVVAANAVVVDHVPAGAVVAGVPARVVSEGVGAATLLHRRDR